MCVLRCGLILDIIFSNVRNIGAKNTAPGMGVENVIGDREEIAKVNLDL